MATKASTKTVKNDEQPSVTAADAQPVAVEAAPEPTTRDATEKQVSDVLAEFRETGRVRSGFAISYSWRPPVRKAAG